MFQSFLCYMEELYDHHHKVMNGSVEATEEGGS